MVKPSMFPLHLLGFVDFVDDDDDYEENVFESRDDLSHVAQRALRTSAVAEYFRVRFSTLDLSS